MRILIVDTFYGPYLERLYAGGSLAQQTWAQQSKAHFAGGFGTGDAYSHGLGLLGVPAIEIVANSPVLQMAWAREHQPALLEVPPGIQQLLAILEGQIRWWKPTVLYVQDINWLPAAFLQHVRTLVEMVVGQNACPLAPGLDLSPYDLLLTSLPHYVGHFRNQGVQAAYFPIGFDQRLLHRHRSDASRPHALTFVGGLGRLHSQGTQMLEGIAQELPLQVWGYGGEQLPVDSTLRQRWRGEAWADDMYALLASSQITLNRHIDIAGAYACNMRLYEATGMGACLITDYKSNICTLFDVDREIVTFESSDEAIVKAKELMSNPKLATEIAQRGQARTLKEHTYELRMKMLVELLEKHQASRTGIDSDFTCSSTGKRIVIPVCVTSQKFDSALRWALWMQLRNEYVEFYFIVDERLYSPRQRIWTMPPGEDKYSAAASFLDCMQTSGFAIIYSSQKGDHDDFTRTFASAAVSRGLVLKYLE